ncbi:MAG: hypothetical protein JSR43_03590 [Proteobacteria bacterium]|jgi:tetratricopeptide (TPR) repeat protein|nr:hypothetical protein [Pseudomonadota bacterium]
MLPATTHDFNLAEDRARVALHRALAQLELAERSARPFAMTQSLAALARCYRRLRAPASAEATYSAALRWARASGAADQTVDLLCEMAETAAHHLLELAPAPDDDPHAGRAARHAARERAREHVFEAARLAPTVADGTWEVQVLLRLSDVLEQCGDHDDAALLQTRALHLVGGHDDRTADPARLPRVGRMVDD